MPSNYDSEKEVAAQSHPDPEVDPADSHPKHKKWWHFWKY